jgi:hypothetical protein
MWGRGVGPSVTQRPEAGSFPRDCHQNIQEVACRPCKPIDARHYEGYLVLRDERPRGGVGLDRPSLRSPSRATVISPLTSQLDQIFSTEMRRQEFQPPS